MTTRWRTGTVASGGGEEIYFEVSGDDGLPTIMLTHGAGGTHAAWFQQVPTLAAGGFRVITWDPTFVKRDPALAFLYQQLNTFHTPPVAAVGAALPGEAVAHADLDATGVPVLVITSDGDGLFPAHLVIDSAQRLANASVTEIADAGHSTYFERPDRYNDALIAFIENVGR